MTPTSLVLFITSIIQFTGHLSEGSFVQIGVVQILKFEANPNHNPMSIRFRQMTLRTSELSLYNTVLVHLL